MNIIEIDLMDHSAAKPREPVHLLFIHHTAGGQLMADRGGIKGQSGIFKTHPNGGGLRTSLGQNNYVVHEAASGSKIGEQTDVCHWNRKFCDQMGHIIRTRHQDILHGDGARNRVIMFQSGSDCNWIDSEGIEPGSPDSPEKTFANYRAAYRSLLNYFRQEPETLFIALTAAPLAKPEPAQGIIQRFVERLARNPSDEVGQRCRTFNNWLKNINSGWLKNYPLKNVITYDYYDILTSHGASNWLRYQSVNGKDGYPSAGGNTLAAERFIPFINRALNRMVRRVSNFPLRSSADIMSAV